MYTDVVKSDVLQSDAIKSVQSKQMIMDSFEVFLSMMDMMVYLLVGGALLLGIVVLYNLGTMSYTERYREMATLKVVGFRDKRIGRLLAEQNLVLSVIGIIIGVPLGALTLSYLLKVLRFAITRRRVKTTIAKIAICRFGRISIKEKHNGNHRRTIRSRKTKRKI